MCVGNLSIATSKHADSSLSSHSKLPFFHMVQEFLASLGLEGSLCFHMRERYCEIPLEP